MKIPKLICLLCFTIGSLNAESPQVREWAIGDKLKVVMPETFRVAEPFSIKLQFLKAPDAPQRLMVGFDYLGAKGKFFRKLPGSLKINGAEKNKKTLEKAETVEVEAIVTEAPEGLEAALLTLYLSPDAAWKNRTLQAVLPIRAESAPADGVFARAVEKALKQDGTPPNNEGEGEAYVPRTEYFTQRAINGKESIWTTSVPQALPPLDSIVRAIPDERPVYALYSWADEYAKAAEEIARIGFRSIRLAGPWARADEALRKAAQNGVEVLFTLKAGDTAEAYRQNTRDSYSSDGEFIAAFTANVAAFLKKYGPGGEFEKSTGLKTPVKVVEMWNEPNFFYMIGDGANRREKEPLREALYPKVLKAGYQTAKAISPEMQVAAFAAGGAESADLRFIKNIFKSTPDIGEFFDILTTHPYNKGAPPEAERTRKWGSYSIANNLAKIRQDMGPFSKKPVWYTELGWHFAGRDGGRFETPRERLEDNITPDLHAAYVTRMFVWAMRLGVPRVMIMHLHDADAFNGGYMDKKLQWRPVAHATKAMIEILPNPRLLSAQSDGEGQNYIYTLQADHQKADSAKVVYAWNTMGPKQVKIPTSRAQVEIADMVGNRKSITSTGGSVEVEVGPYPIYIFP